MAEGEAGALALAADKQGVKGFAIAAAFTAAYDRLAGDPSIDRQAQDAATGMVDGAAGDIGSALADQAEGDGSEQDMTDAADEAVSGDSPSLVPRLSDMFWAATGAGTLAFYSLMSQAAAGDAAVTVQVDWLTEPGACVICEQNAANGPYAPDDVPPYLAHPHCVLGSTRIAVPDLPVVSAQVEAGHALELAKRDVRLGRDASATATPAVAEAVSDFGRGIRAVTDREYVGQVVTIRTALGHELTATPNHPIATRGGWIPIAELAVGDHVLSSTGREWVTSSVDPDEDDIPPCIEDVAQSLPVLLDRMPTAAEDFHGDGAGSDIHVVRADRLLGDHAKSGLAEHACKHPLRRRDHRDVGPESLPRGGPGEPGIKADGLAAHGVMGGASEPGALLGARLGHADIHAIAAVPGVYSRLQQPITDGPPVDSEGFCENLLALAGDITADEIVHIDRDVVATHVYNLDTVEGWYIGNGIVTHNCRCWLASMQGLPASIFAVFSD